jgi:hypothetical protein
MLLKNVGKKRNPATGKWQGFEGRRKEETVFCGSAPIKRI